MTHTSSQTLVARIRRPTNVTGATVVSVATVVVGVVASVAIENFPTASNIRAMFLSVSLIGIIAVGLSLITIVGKVFTLSIPSLVALSTIMFASMLHLGPWIALLSTVTASAAVGLVQGIVVGRVGTDPIITTIATAAIMLGIGQLWTSGRTIVGDGDPTFFNSNIFGLFPFQATVFVLFAFTLFWWQKYSTAGRKLMLVGLNERAATIMGLRSWPLITLAFVVSGAATGLAGALLSAQSGQGNLLLGQSFGFDAIVAVVVGGVSIKGGAGTPLGAAIGALFVGLLSNVLALLSLTYETQLVVKGLLVLAAVTATGITARNERSGK